MGPSRAGPSPRAPHARGAAAPLPGLLALGLTLCLVLPGVLPAPGPGNGTALLPTALAGDPEEGGDGAGDAGAAPAADEGAEERREQAENDRKRGLEAFRRGSHDEARLRMDRLERYAPDDPLPDLLRARIDERTGNYEAGLERATKALARFPGNRGLLAARFGLLYRLARAADLEAAARAEVAARPADPLSQAALGLACEERGRRDEALAAYKASLAALTADAPGEDLLGAARAAIRATWLSPNPDDDLLGDAGKLLSRHVDAHPEDVDALMAIADLFQADRGPKGQAKAAKYYKQVLDRNSEVAEARVGLARTMLVFWQQDRAVAELERALRSNPRLVPALSLLAAVHVGNGDYDAARRRLEAALTIAPADKEARSVRAALLYITGEREAYAVLEKAILADDPTYGRLYVTVSDLVGERQRRYDVASDLARKAIATDPNDPLGYVTLGEALMNLGETAEARRHFEASIDKAKRYRDVKRDNWLEVLTVLDGFATVPSKRFVIRMHPSEAEVMARYLPPLLEAAWDALSARYGQVPVGPVRVDAFHRADDFSVRSVGTSGLPALGVCFGEVITLLGPTSRPVGSFSWARTAWHEFAHTITLGRSKGQVPRWLTEGLSVYEEKVRRSNWSREMDRLLYDRWRNDRLLRMATINSAFRGPDIGFAYYQGGLISEHLAATRGFEVIPRMLAAFAEDRTTEEVFRDVLGTELADYDRQFAQYVASVVGGYRLVPRWDDESLDGFLERTKKDPTDAEAFVRLGWAHIQRGRSIDAGAALAKARDLRPGDPEVILLTGRLAQANDRQDLAAEAYDRFLAGGGDDFETRLFLAARAEEDGKGDEVVRHLEAAKACFPAAVGPQSPYVRLAKHHQGAGETAKAIAELEAYAKVAGEDYDVRRKLADWYQAQGDLEALVRVSEEMIDITPFGANRGEPPDLRLHRDFAAALLALGRQDEAIRELEVQALLLGTLEEEARKEAGAVADLLKLGGLYLQAGRALDALEQAVAALRLSPDDTDARMLKARAEEAAGYR